MAATRNLSMTEEHTPQAYFNVAQGEHGLVHGSMSLLVGTRSTPGSAVAAVRSAVASLDSGVAVSNLTPLEERVLSSVGEARFLGVLVGFFGLVALLLAAVGIYALISHTVTQRTREMGVRLALGAKPLEIVREVALRSIYVTGVGLAVGKTEILNTCLIPTTL